MRTGLLKNWYASIFWLCLSGCVVICQPHSLMASNQFAKVERIVSPGGIEVWYVEEPSIPVISVTLGFRGGSVNDPEYKSGLGNFALALLDEGAGHLDGLEFRQALADRGINFNTDLSHDLVSISLQTLSKHKEEAFSLLGLALKEANFQPDAVNRIRSQILNIIAEKERDPRTIAGQRWYRDTLKNHPYAKPTEGTKKSIEAISSIDLKKWVKKNFVLENLIVGVAGDISGDEIAELIDNALIGLKDYSSVAKITDFNFPNVGSTQIIEMPLSQSVIVFGLDGLKRKDPDFYAAYVMNHILGGGSFSSRFYQEIREKRGLAYSVYSYFLTRQHGGLFLGSVSTRNDAVSQVLSIIRSEISKMEKNGVSKKELLAAKKYLTGAFPLRFDSGFKISKILVQMQLESLGIKFLGERNRLIEIVTQKDVKRVAKRLLNSEQLRVVVVGDPNNLKKSKLQDATAK